MSEKKESERNREKDLKGRMTATFQKFAKENDMPEDEVWNLAVSILTISDASHEHG